MYNVNEDCLWSMHHSLCPFTFVGSRFRLWAWVVAFVCGRSSSFGGVRLCSWAVCLHSWATAGCGGGEPLVVVSPWGWHRHVVAWLLWSCRGARWWCVSQLSCRCLVATSPAATWHLWLVSMRRQGGGLCCLPGLGTTWPPSCHHCVVVGTRWWWWMGCVVDGGGGGKEEATTWQ